MSGSAERRVTLPEATETTEATEPLALTRLAADDLIERRGAAWRTSRRFQRAMARAAVSLYEAGDAGDDLRVPIALALLEVYGGKVHDETFAELIETMLPIELVSLGFVQR